MENVIQKSRGRARRWKTGTSESDAGLLLKLYELLQGERGVIRVHSNVLGSDVYFVNPAVCDLAELQSDCPVYTTGELAQVLELPPEGLGEFNRQKK